MHLVYSLTKSDVVQGKMLQERVWRKSAVLGLLAFAIALALEVNASGIPSTGSELIRVTVAPITMGVGFGFVFPLSRRLIHFPLLVGQVYRRNPSLFRDLQLFADSEGVRIAGADRSFQLLWPELQGFMENATLFVLYVSRSVGHFVPKQSLSTEEIAQFRELLSAKLKKLSPL
jgi:hypothetical protein